MSDGRVDIGAVLDAIALVGSAVLPEASAEEGDDAMLLMDDVLASDGAAGVAPGCSVEVELSSEHVSTLAADGLLADGRAATVDATPSVGELPRRGETMTLAAWPKDTVLRADERTEVKVVHSVEEVPSFGELLGIPETMALAAVAIVDVFDAACPIVTVVMADEMIEVKVVQSAEEVPSNGEVLASADELASNAILLGSESLAKEVVVVNVRFS